ncbi:MAG: hypothetical protein KatS3mg089_0014 [Patescibacteria group bacterium]|nr:MAG: hypothetical protein KatS3mg089_0014 [Patescibacteria group bacterium]
MSDQLFPTFSSLSDETSRRNRAFIYVALFLLFIGVAIYVGNQFLGSKKTNTQHSIPSPVKSQPTLAQLSPTPTKNESRTSTPSSTLTTTPQPTAKALEGVKTSLRIQVLNGSGEKGAAGKGAAVLRSAGYNVVSVDNADSFDYVKTVLQLKKSKNQFKESLLKDLSKSYKVDSTVQTLAEASSFDAIVIIGSE